MISRTTHTADRNTADRTVFGRTVFSSTVFSSTVFGSVVVALVLALALPAATVQAQGIAELEIEGNQAKAEIALPGFSADIELEFEQAVGLSAANLGISAQEISLTSLATRLPAGSTIPVGFPVLLTIEPPLTGGLSFSGIYSLELHTHDLSFTAGCPLRLFKADDGGPFEDVSVLMGTGSYRVRGHSGGFSEFLILSDTRVNSSVVSLKLDRLGDFLEDHSSSMSTSTYNTLSSLLASADEAWQDGETQTAIADLDDFIDEVVNSSGSDIPDVWRASRDLVNVAGELRSGARTLRFSMALEP